MSLIINKLYKDEIELVFEPMGHKYTVDDKPVRSVTNINSIIAKPALVPWAANMAVQSMREAIKAGESYDELYLENAFGEARIAHSKKKTDSGVLGTLVHKWVENYIGWRVYQASEKGKLDPKVDTLKPAMTINETAQKACERFLFWEAEHKVKFLVTEQVVYSKEYNYTGTLDFICVIDGKMYVGDLKTSSGIWPEYYLQTAAYRHARLEEYPTEEYAGQVIVRVGKKDEEFAGKKGGVEIAYLRGDEIYKKCFVGFLGAWKLSDIMGQLEGYKPDTI